MADAVCGLILFYSLVFGARRGFYKEVVQTLAVVLAILLARVLRQPVGAWITAKTSVPSGISEVVAVVAVWVVGFLVVAVVGRLILKKLRGQGIDDNLDEGAEAIADALGGDTAKGPVTLLTDPIATKTGIFYWSDKLLGAGLGLGKGVVTVIVVFALVLYADRARGWESSFAESIEASYAARGFRAYLEPYLETFPEYRITTSLRSMRGIAAAVKEDPRRFAAFAGHPELKGLRGHAKLAEVARDPEVAAAWAERDLQRLLGHEQVRALLGDRELRERIAEVDWEAVLADVKGGGPDAAREAEALRGLAEEAPGGAAPGDPPGGGAPAVPEGAPAGGGEF